MKHNKPYLLLDIDGCVLDWESGLVSFMNQCVTHIKQPETLSESSYYLDSRYNITPEQAKSIVEDFHAHPSFGKLLPLDGANQAIDYLKNKYRCVAITACGDTDQIISYREKNLYDCFGDAFVTLHCVADSESKRKYLDYYPPSNWVEDHVTNAQMGVEYGHTSWLINAPYNVTKKVDSRIKRINKLSDLCNLI